MTPGRVALLAGSATGGMGAHVRMLAEGLPARGIAVSLFAPAGTGADLGLTSLPDVEFTPVEFGDRPRMADMTAVVTLRRALRATGADVAHAHGMRAGALTALALIGVRRAPGLVVTVHNAPPETGRRAARLVYLTLERLVARRAALVLCVSGDLEQRMRERGARRVGRAVVPAPERSAPGPAAEAVAPRPEGEDRPVILAVGRLVPQKGFDTLLDAARDWRDRTPAPRLVIAGDGPLRDDLTRRAASDGIDAEFPGHVHDIPARLRAAAVFVLPSRWEGQPLVLQEALKAGAVIVATRTGGIPELTGKDAALLVPPGDPRGLARAIQAALSDGERAAALRTNARARAAALPSAEQAVTSVLTGYARVPR